MTTREILKAITDRALFERLGTAVLRLKFPLLENLIASGVNEKGETIKDPIDAFAQTDKNQLAWVAYTTNDSNLKRKWLNEKLTKKSPLGDLILLIKAARNKRFHDPNTEVFIYLVTNQSVSSDLEAEIRSKVSDDFITLEIIDNSIIADFLDFNNIGQYLRKQFLGIEAELLSDLLLQEIIDKNLTNYGVEIYIYQRELIETTAIEDLQNELDSLTKKLALIIGESAAGKSTAAFATMKRYITNGYTTLRVDPQIINEAGGIYNAIERQLVKEHPQLFIQKDKIKQFFSGKCLIVIDDINKQENAWELGASLVQNAQTAISYEPEPIS